jgi:tetratricopeptide (TPR) repeat protein
MAVDQKMWNRAASEFEQFVQDYPKDGLALDALYRLGQAYENLKEVEKAMIQYRHILAQFASKATSVDAAFRLGSLYFAQEKYQEAVEVFRAALPKKMANDTRANLQYNMAICYENLGQLDNAATAYGEFAKLAKTKEQMRESLMTAGVLSKKSENYAAAVKYFEQLLKDPGSPEIQLKSVNLMADCYKSAGNETEAIKTYQKLLGMEPASSDLRLAGLAQLAYLYEQRKNMSEAVKVYEKIAVSDGKAEWVTAAQGRIKSITQTTNAMP